jgi:colanic acid/amylovoran biosynthesis glycosyltransferase
MRIAYLINRYPAVSHSFIRREIQALERLGHDVLRISIRGLGEPLPGREDQLEQHRTRYVLQQGPFQLTVALLRRSLTRPLSLLSAFRLAWKTGRRAERPLAIQFIYLLEACRIAEWLSAEGVEHLHAHFGTNSAQVAMLVRELGGPPWSFTVHGPEEFDKAPLIALSEKIRRAEFVVAISSFGRSQLYRLVSRDHWKKVHVVHCGIEAAFHDVPGPRNGYLGRRLICIGRLCEQKGQLLLLDAMRVLVERGTQFELVLAGDGEMRDELEQLVAEHRLEPFVRITGWISGDQVRQEILAARAMVLPSFAEGLPVVLMEAMALGTPVISTFVAGIPELVKPGDHGWLVPAGDVDGLVSAMKECLDASSEALEQMGARTRTQVLQSHNIDQEAAKLADLFEAATPRPKRSD